jgi:hypothetical protein
MRFATRLVLASGAVSAVGITAVPTLGQAQPAGDWQYSEGPEICRAYRTYGTGANSTLLQLRTFGPNSAVELVAAGAQVPNEPHSTRLVELGWDGKGFDKTQVGILGSIDGIPSVALLTAHRPTTAFAFFFDELTVVTSALDPSAESVQLRVVGNAPKELQMGSLAEPLRHLAECEARLMGKWGWGSDYAQRVATPPKMRDPQSWFFKAIRYPAVQNLTRVSSFLQLRLKVDERGRVAECVVQSSPGSSEFGSKNCTGIRKYARLDPALDPQGQPVESYMQMSVTFARFD